MSAMLNGIVSGERVRSRQEFGVRVRRIAGGLRAFGVEPGDSVAILMRNDIAFLETSFAAMTLGAYAVPVNWHFKAEEVAYVVSDCGAKALIGHADLLAAGGAGAPAGVPAVWLATPPEIVSAYRIEPARAAVPDRRDRLRGLARGSCALRRAAGAAAAEHDLHLGHDGSSQGRAPQGADRARERSQREPAHAGLWRDGGRALPAARAALSFRAQFLRPARGAARRTARADAALRRARPCCG